MSDSTTHPCFFLIESPVREMRAHAETEYPNECCGLMLGHSDEYGIRVTEVVPAENIAEGDRRLSYQIDWSTMLAVQRRAREEQVAVVGFYHSHPDGSAAPSDRDRREAWVDYAYLIVPVLHGQAGEISAWRLQDEYGVFEPETLTITATQKTSRP